MTFSPSFPPNYQASFGKNWAWFFIWGIILIVLGLCAISLAAFTTILSVIFLGILIAAAGIVLIVDAFQFWWHKWLGFFLHILIGLLYLIVGLSLLHNPIMAAASLTFILGIFYVLIGLFRLTYSLFMRLRQWGWSFISGLISLVLGVLILSSWPESSLFIIGLFIGIDLFFVGWTYVMLSLAARR